MVGKRYAFSRNCPSVFECCPFLMFVMCDMIFPHDAWQHERNPHQSPSPVSPALPGTNNQHTGTLFLTSSAVFNKS